jgi:diguanylate cyclase (GGDEF)-like protein
MSRDATAEVMIAAQAPIGARMAPAHPAAPSEHVPSDPGVGGAVSAVAGRGVPSGVVLDGMLTRVALGGVPSDRDVRRGPLARIRATRRGPRAGDRARPPARGLRARVPVVGRLHAHLAGLPVEAASMATLFAAAAVALAISVAFPMSPQAPVAFARVLAVVVTVLAVATFAFGGRLPRTVLLGEAVVSAALGNALVAVSATTGGAMVDAFAHVWLTVYVALFFPQAAMAFATMVAAGFGVALLVAGMPGAVTAWSVLTISVLCVAFVLSRLSRAVRRLVEVDGLTGVLNRQAFTAAAARAGERARRRGEALAVVAIDLDGFKEVNDSLGHAAGDRLLADVSAAWRGALRDGDLLARTGGDEFVLLLPDTSVEEAAAVVRRLRRAHEARWSAGVAAWYDGETLAACLERADRALYEEKALRRGASVSASAPARGPDGAPAPQPSPRPVA